MLLAAALLIVSPASAQEIVEPTDRQLALAVKADEAFQSQDYARAALLLEDALKEGDLNVLLLNLGRSYYRLDRCARAKDVFDRMPSAPRVKDPPHAVINRQLQKYRADLGTCPGALIVRCDPADMMLSVDDAEPRPCDGRPIALSPGEHTLEGIKGEERVRRQITVTSMQTREVAFKISAPLAVEDPADKKDELVDVFGEGDKKGGPPEIKIPPEVGGGDEGGAYNAWAWSAVGAGGAFLGASVLLDVLVLGPALDDYDRALRDFDDAAADGFRQDIDLLQPSLIATYAVGGALVGTGILMLLTDTGAESSNPAPGLDLVVTPEAGLVRWRAPW